MLSTRFSLLLNLRDLANRKSWGEFVETYTPVISNTIRRYRVSSSDADDILQEVLELQKQHRNKFVILCVNFDQYSTSLVF